ncbi:MAG TPA: mechanosensitive ion channel domain-containing protein [Aliidongia sp.]|uniref:mechanosensitive ion channel domain-containing protein n=1 Tax=Aliidongia sp. TaxID=1914230 RepID=UPI002DDDA741|nr:mechanosensitive ion channel domain-containing protein [Aliidongia sp.]HEV2677579.1 mechanosensitive ion channel domain-containing protein [Aliidongia sp.]
MSNPSNLLRRILFCALVLVGFGLAQQPVAAATAASPKQVTDQAGVSADDLDKLVSTLQDDQKRQQLIKQLQTLSTAEKGAAPPPPPPTPSDLLSVVTEHLQGIGSDMVDATTVLIGAPHLMGWFNRQVYDPAARTVWEEVGRNIGLILAAAILSDFVMRQLAQAIHRRATRRNPKTWLGRIGLLLLAILLAGLPFFAFLIAADLTADYLQPRESTRRVAIVLIHAFVYARLIIVTSWTLLLAPRAAGWTLVPVTEETANYLFIWVRRFTQVAFYGFALIPAAWWLGAPGAVSAIVQKLVALLLTVLGILFVLQNRQSVAQWLRPHRRPVADPEAAADASATRDTAGEVPEPASGTISIIRHRLAEVWHILAIVYIVTIFAVYALKIEGGFIFVFRATAFTIAILIAVRLFGRGIKRLTERGFAIPGDLRERFPTLEARANRYVPVLNLAAIVVIWGFAILGFLEAWGFGSFAWLRSATGRQLTGSTITIALILAVAFGCWEIFNAAVDRYLAGVDSRGQRISRSARVRTLLPFARNAVWILLLLLVVLLVLSELGINIAPLLAGAGVVGLAIGFGSQALVKDIITGLFMLVEDTIAVGDIVDLGGGNTGVIEAISIRTIKLRDNAGSVHTIPYSTVTQVRNLTKDFAYHVIDLTVAYGSDPDIVIAILQAVYEDMKGDPAFGPFMLAEIEIFGLNGFAPNAMSFQGRIKTLPMKQWAIGREFSRRLKRALDDAKIYLPGMVPGAIQTIDFGERAAKVLSQLQFAMPQAAPPQPIEEPPNPAPGKPAAEPA